MEKSKEQVLAKFANNLRRLRTARGLTQAKLAEAVQVELRTLQKFEAAEINPPLFTLHRIRKALQCTWEELLS